MMRDKKKIKYFSKSEQRRLESMKADMGVEKKGYGDWICRACGLEKGTRVPEAATYHFGKCDWCGAENVAITQPRDYGYPKMPKKMDSYLDKVLEEKKREEKNESKKAV